jgi:hypothetical protein
MATSEVSICNSALSKIGADRIVSLDDDSRAAKLCKEQYPKVRDALFRVHPWNFAIKRVALAASPTTPDFGFAYAYPLPSDFSRALEVNENEGEWVKEMDSILTDDDTCELLYIARVAVGYFDDIFSELLATKLAHDICGDLTTSPTLKRDLYAEYQNMLREARSFDAQEGSAKKFKTYTFLNSRR